MTYERLIASIKKYGSTEQDICSQFIGVSDSALKQKVVIAPWWEPSVFDKNWNKVTFKSKSEHSTIKVWNIETQKGDFSYIKTGIGAPMLTDIILSLGVTSCTEILFIGSVGSLDPNINIGDIVIPEYSLCGDGFSRYLKGGSLTENDPFGEKAYPNNKLTQKLISISNKIGSENNIKIHQGRNFSIDTIFAQFAFIGEILNLNCNVIEMETASAFRAAEIAKIPITALFSVSDNTILKKSLVNGRTKEEVNYRKNVRENVFPRIIESLFFD